MTTTLANLIVLAGQRPLRIDDLPGEDTIYRHELIDGSLYVTPLANVEHQGLVASMVILLASTIPDDAVVLPGANVIHGDDIVVLPDVLVVEPNRLVRNGLGVSPAGLLFVVEITSPSTRRRDLTLKRDLYEEWKVPYLVVDRSTELRTYRSYGELPIWAEVVRP